ncbi:MAG: 4-phosphoerythronate dehydrogenase, partial [Alistipes senegalensis]|nr:4-phosphoerythronate dehydrogenase [Alistipes senegalensis]
RGRACALDVWEGEPRIDRALLRHALLATPHIAGYSEQGKATATALSVQAVARMFGLPLAGWYPPTAAPSAPRPISWPELCSTIDRAFDIEAQSRRLKADPQGFERMRDRYAYRREYF